MSVKIQLSIVVTLAQPAVQRCPTSKCIGDPSMSLVSLLMNANVVIHSIHLWLEVDHY